MQSGSSGGARRLAVALVASFVALVGLRLHGYSIPAWRAVIDGSEPAEVLLGEARRIRADDWFLRVPLALAQRAHEPRYPRVNENIGLGSPMLVPLELPVASSLTLFRPNQWGYFLGPDLGVAWAWWFAAIGLYAVSFLIFQIVTEGRFGLSALGALAVLFAPFFQFWSLGGATVVIYGGLALVAAWGLLVSTQPRAILRYGVLLGWAAGCFALSLYPAFQVPIAYLGAVLLAALVWDRRHALELRRELRRRLVALGLAVTLVAAAAGLLLLEAGDAIRALRDAVYPGDRVDVGGSIPLWRVFGHNLAYAWQVRDWGVMLNICEASSFILFFPIVALGVATRTRAKGEGADRICVALAVYCFAALLYAAVGVPESLARATGLSLVPGRRMLLGLGVADAILLVRFLSLPASEDPRAQRFALAGACAFGLGLIVVAVFVHLAVPDTHPAWLAQLAIANAVVAGWMLVAQRPEIAMAAVAVGSMAATVWFNPLVRGGTEYLLENPLSRKILAIDRQHGGDTFWLTVGSRYAPNLFRALGVRALDGTHPVPQLELWLRLDPRARYRNVYNRYAHVWVHPTEADRSPQFRLEAVDGFSLRIRPDAPALRRLGLTHLLATAAAAVRLEEIGGLRHVGSVGGFRIYSLAPEGTVGAGSEGRSGASLAGWAR